MANTSKQDKNNVNERNARRELLEDLFQDHYKHRNQVYKINFIRGIVFGLGSALGGTVVLAVLVWAVLQIPGVNTFIREIEQSIRQS